MWKKSEVRVGAVPLYTVLRPLLTFLLHTYSSCVQLQHKGLAGSTRSCLVDKHRKTIVGVVVEDIADVLNDWGKQKYS